MNKAEIKRILATYIEADVGATITGFEIASEKIADFAEKEVINLLQNQNKEILKKNPDLEFEADFSELSVIYVNNEYLIEKYKNQKFKENEQS